MDTNEQVAIAIAVNLHRGDFFTQNTQTYTKACIAIARMCLRGDSDQSSKNSAF